MIRAYRRAGTDLTGVDWLEPQLSDQQWTLATIGASERQLALPLSIRSGTIRWR
jgi:hypothetical protein